MNIEIYPLEKAVLEGAEIYLGMDRAAVETAIGAGQFLRDRYYYSELAISYDSNDKVEFIEFLGGIGGSLKPTIYGVSAFDTNADELLELLKQQNAGEVDDCENGYSYAFLNISVGVYREAIPESVSEMIEEAKAFGNPMTDDEIEYEMKRANHWATIGIGVKGYYQK